MSTVPELIYFFSVEMLSGVRALKKIDSYYWSCTACCFLTYMVCSGYKKIILSPENLCKSNDYTLFEISFIIMRNKDG